MKISGTKAHGYINSCHAPLDFAIRGSFALHRASPGYDERLCVQPVHIHGSRWLRDSSLINIDVAAGTSGAILV